MRDYDLGDLPQQCYLNAIKIVDTLQPILEDIETNEQLFNYKEAEYDLLMAWLDILITQKTATEQACFELLLRIRDECVKYLPDLKLSFVNQM